MITDTGIKKIAIAMGSGTIPTHVAIGTGSSTIVSGNTILDSESDRNAVSTYDVSSNNQTTYIADFSSNEISGTTLTEFGLFNDASGGQLWQRDVVGSVEFQGDRELQIQLTYRYSRA